MDDTRSQLLSEAESLIRTQGYAAFSYADLAEKVGIRKASIHHHFPTKEILGAALIDEYLVRFEKDLHSIFADENNVESRLTAYAKLFSDSVKGGMLPLCGALSAEVAVLPSSLGNRVRKFFEMHLNWLKLVLKRGLDDGELSPELNVDRTALLVLTCLEGACFVSWALGDTKLVRTSFKDVLAHVCSQR
jgi:TetR/AcrR family transcriptional repressor of nem operon